MIKLQENINYLHMQGMASQQEIKISKDTPYLQRQKGSNLLCGVHALNNLFGEHHFDENYFQSICQQLSVAENSTDHKYRHICKCIGGQYDANVMFQALSKAGYDTEWIDKRKQFTLNVLIEKSSKESTVGFLLNIKQDKHFFKKILSRLFCLSSRHWCTIKKFNNKFVLLDSLFEDPLFFKSHQQVVHFIKLQLEKEGEIILVKSNPSKMTQI